MASVFLPCGMGVARIQDPCSEKKGSGSPKVLTIDDLPSGIIITEFSLELSTNHQFLHALDRKIYLFPFGDRIGELTVTGMAFTGGYCSPGGQVKSAKDAMCGPLGYYMQNRVSGPKGLTPKKITISECAPPFLGFVTGFRMAQQRTDVPIAQWIMRFSVVIDPQGGGGAGAVAARPAGYGGSS